MTQVDRRLLYQYPQFNDRNGCDYRATAEEAAQ